MTENLLKQVLMEQKDLIKPSQDYVTREVMGKVGRICKLKHIVVITGHRRAGKSVFLTQIADRFYGKDDVYYLNFDDERLVSLRCDDVHKVMDVFHQLFGNKRVIFLDEVQNLEGWERFVSRLYNQGYKVYVTGSNAKLLSSELASHLTGRHVDIEIFPFSFREYLTYKGLDVDVAIKEKAYYKGEVKAEVSRLLSEYLTVGGFPEVVRSGESSILRTLFSDVVAKDVVNRYKVKESRTVREIAHYLVSNYAREFSYNRLRNIYSLGSVHTVKNYVGHLVSTYMIFELSRFSYSVKELHTKVKKVYVVDNGLVNAVGYTGTSDVGWLYENVVFLELRRRGGEIYYYKDKRGREVDFLVWDGRKVVEAIQVCFDVADDRVLRRELRSLSSCLDVLRLKGGLVITSDLEDRRVVNGHTIEFRPLWKWLLGLGV